MSVSVSEKSELKDYVNAFYSIVGRTWTTDLNDEAANVFYIMLTEAAECSGAMDWVPRAPIPGGVNVKWLLKNLRRSLINAMRDKFYTICVQRTIGNWDTTLRIKCL